MISVGLGFGRRLGAPLALAAGRVGWMTSIGICFARRVAALLVREGPAQPLGRGTGVVAGLVSASRSAVRGSRLSAAHAWVSRFVIWLLSFSVRLSRVRSSSSASKANTNDR